MKNIEWKKSSLNLNKLNNLTHKQLTSKANGEHNVKSGLLKSIAKKGGDKTYQKYGNPAAGKYGKSILQYDLDGNFIKEWKGAFVAAEYYNVNNVQISDIVNGRGDSTLGFMWKKKISDNIPQNIESLYDLQNPKCKYCNKRFTKGMFNRWHGDNCKHKN